MSTTEKILLTVRGVDCRALLKMFRGQITIYWILILWILQTWEICFLGRIIIHVPTPQHSRRFSFCIPRLCCVAQEAGKYTLENVRGNPTRQIIPAILTWHFQIMHRNVTHRNVAVSTRLGTRGTCGGGHCHGAPAPGSDYSNIIGSFHISGWGK